MSIKVIVDAGKGLYQTRGDGGLFVSSGSTVDLGSNVLYTPENPGDWSAVPGNLIQAVDYLAAGSGSGGGGGGGIPGGSNGQIQYRVDASTFGGVNKLTFVGGNLVGTGSFNGIFSGSLTKLEDGSNYLLAGSNVTLTTGSNGAVTIAASGGSSAGSANEIQLGDGLGGFSASGELTYTPGGTLTVAAAGASLDFVVGSGEVFITGNNNMTLESPSGAVTVSGSNSIKLDTNDLQIANAGVVSYHLPVVDGTANQVLKTDGAGNVSWSAGGGGGTLPFRQGAWVDPSNPTAVDDSDTSTPFVTIQAAIDALTTIAQAASPGWPTSPYSPTVQMQIQTIWVAPGIYDEDVTVPPGLAWCLVAMGGVTIGNGVNDNLVSSNTRNFTWQIDGNTEPKAGGAYTKQIRPTLFLTTWTSGPMSSTHTAYACGWIISGELRMQQMGTGAPATSTTELHLNQVKVTGAVVKDYGALGSTGQMNCYFKHCFFDSACGLTGANLTFAYDCEFDSTLTIGTYCRFSECELNGNITVSTGYSELLPPGGFLNCKFTALTFTSAGALVVDAYSNASAKAAPVTLAGASKTILGDLTA